MREPACPFVSACLAALVFLALALTVDSPAGAQGLPGGGIARASSGDIVRAWYSRPTGRYDHGVLGDAIEAGGLVVETGSGLRAEFVLPETHVFEDLTPRIADLDGDGTNEVVAIRSSLTRGAAVAVYGLRQGRLVELASTAEIGRRNRWLNIAGIARYWGSTAPVIAWVETPHISGTLKAARFRGGGLHPHGPVVRDVSNHVIGSSELRLSATGDFDGDGLLDLAVPSAGRDEIVVVTKSSVKRLRVGGRIAGRMDVSGGRIRARTAEGGVVSVRP